MSKAKRSIRRGLIVGSSGFDGPSYRSRLSREIAGLRRAVARIDRDSSRLLLRKHRDYGSDNISSSGLLGIAIRLSDKVCRLSNLLRSGEEPRYEPLEDTLLDIRNYAEIGILIERGEWPGLKRREE